MKTIKNNLKTIMLLLLIGFVFASCSSDDDSVTDQDDNTGGKDMVATIDFESGDEVDFAYTFPKIDFGKPLITSEEGREEEILTVVGTMGEYGISIIASINGEGEYVFTQDDDEKGVHIRLSKNNNDDDDIDTYVPFYIKDDILGSAKLTITKLTENTIEATFSATVYELETGKKATIKGGEFNGDVVRYEG